MLCHVALVRTDVSEELRVTRIFELGKIAVTSNRHTFRRNTNWKLQIFQREKCILLSHEQNAKKNHEKKYITNLLSPCLLPNNTTIWIFNTVTYTRWVVWLITRRGFGLDAGFIRYDDHNYTDYNYWLTQQLTTKYRLSDLTPLTTETLLNTGFRLL
jgi:hypothetical protein